MHLQNSILYSWGLVFNLLAASRAPEWKAAGFESSTQLWWWLLFVANGACHGLVIAFVMKILSSIWKLFMSASAVLVAGILQMALVRTPPLPAPPARAKLTARQPAAGRQRAARLILHGGGHPHVGAVPLQHARCAAPPRLPWPARALTHALAASVT